MRRSWIVAVAAGLALVMGTSVSEADIPASSPGRSMIIIYESSYYPMRLQVAPGTLITVAHEEAGTPHSVTARDGSFDTGVFFGDIREFTAPQTPGRYPYSCKVHGPRVMRGVIFVTAGPGDGVADITASALQPLFHGQAQVPIQRTARDSHSRR